VSPKEILMEKRERIKLERKEGDRNRVTQRDATVLWFDTGVLAETEAFTVLSRLPSTGYRGALLHDDNIDTFAPLLSSSLERILDLPTQKAWEEFVANANRRASVKTIASADTTILDQARREGLATCFRAFVDDAQSLHGAIEIGGQHDYLMVSFRDPTNIPLELVIATLQATQTILIKEIRDEKDFDDAIVTLGVMEVGADGVMYSPRDVSVMDRLRDKLANKRSARVELEPATILRAIPVGMGYRSCIDLATLFSAHEGMIVGSTSQGGILCCPEVFFLPYMELRPFRVNAGAVHSYVYNFENRTDYMSELAAGSSVMIVGINGETRRAPVGRMKTEIRPLRMLEAQFASGEKINVLMQDDWHVRVFSPEGLPLNITELKPGDQVLAHRAQPGRHVGIKVDEHIVEN